MSLRDLSREAFRALEANKVRSLLTVLGVVIGISAVIAMTSLIGGVQNNLIGSLGLNAARALHLSYYGGSFTSADVEKIAASNVQIEDAAGMASSYAMLGEGENQISVGINGCSPTLMQMMGYDQLIAGRMYTEADEATGARVCVIGRNAIRKLFDCADEEAVGRSLTINRHTYTVVGVRDDGATGDDYFNAFMPLSTVQKDFNGGSDVITEAVILACEGVDVDALGEEVMSTLAVMKGHEDDAEDYMGVYSMKSVVDQMNNFMGSFQFIMGAVAGVSLLVGGIGIMNMMLTNVTERIREIGVRRALGATRRDIELQFLTESAALCLTGGVIGIVVGYLVAWGLSFAASAMGVVDSLGGNSATAIVPDFSLVTVLAAVGVSVGIGLLFGYYPARRAASLDPVECLRYQ